MPPKLQPPVGAEFIGVESAAQMFSAVKNFFGKCDCLIMAAAVADYTPVKYSKTKIKKGKRALTIRLKPTPDILKWAGNQKLKTNNLKLKTQIIVGFALEDKDMHQQAEKKLKEKNLDMIIANKPDVIGSEKTRVDVKTSSNYWQRFVKASKKDVAEKIISFVEHVAVKNWSAKNTLFLQMYD